jgi:murein endopeptidase
MHGSHQSGRDVDIGFYFKTRPRHYPAEFVVATTDTIDVAACFALLTALADTASRPGGVERMYISYDTQAMLYRLGQKRGISGATLDRLFQYPHGEDSQHGIIHHEPGHDDHVHVRFQCPPGDSECR